jgi:hypothetical protein
VYPNVSKPKMTNSTTRTNVEARKTDSETMVFCRQSVGLTDVISFTLTYLSTV